MSGFLIRTRDGLAVASHVGPAAEQVNVPEGETAERFDTADEFEARLAELAPDPGPDPDAELDDGLSEVAARTDVPEWGQALIDTLRGQTGHAGRAAGRRPDA